VKARHSRTRASATQKRSSSWLEKRFKERTI
jgi:hypothetical protein